MHIESLMQKMTLETEFGWIKVNNDRYEKDIVIHCDGKITKREKKKSKDLKTSYGHTPLSEKELGFLSNEAFEALYIGSGHENALPITPKAMKMLKKYDAIILPTPEVIRKIESEERPFVAIIHITC